MPIVDIAYVDTGVLCDEVGHLTPFLLQINQIKSQILTQLLTYADFLQDSLKIIKYFRDGYPSEFR